MSIQSCEWISAWTCWSKCRNFWRYTSFLGLRNENQQSEHWQDQFSIAPQTVQIFKSGSQSEEPTAHLPGQDAKFTVHRQVEACTRIRTWRHHILQVWWRTCEPPTDCSTSTVGRRHIIETENLILPQGPAAYLGNVIQRGRIGVSTNATKQIRRQRYPTKVTNRRSFLGLCHEFRRFFPDFTRISGPSIGKLKKGQVILLRTTKKHWNWSSGVVTVSIDVNINTITANPKRTLYTWH